MEGYEEIKRRMGILVSSMQKAGVDYYLMTSTDYHGSEYVGDYFKVTEYFSGCTSDNVTLIVSKNSIKLWTDGRYFISAARELEGTGIELMKMGQPEVPTVQEYLKSVLESEQVLGYDGRCIRASLGAVYSKIAKEKGAQVDNRCDLASKVWTDRPALASNPVMVLSDEVAGKTFSEKLADVRDFLEKHDCKYLILSKLDDIAWLLNIRGNDIECNPVVISYLLVSRDTVDFFIQDSELNDDLRDYARANRIKLHSYEDFFLYLKDYHFEGKVLLDHAVVSDSLWELVAGKTEIYNASNPTALMKACKNDVEIKYSKKYYLLDSVAVCRFIYWVKHTIGTIPMTEYTAAMHLDSLRAEIPGYIELSFPTISAYGPNAAMAHYSATKESASELKPEGFLLVDSGGQYMGGTTDVTRTIVLGPVSDEMKRDYTLVAISNLALLDAKYLYGCTGRILDIIAREPLWENGIDFNHGTGHGIGYILNVHEGPQNISWHYREGLKEAVLEPGMIISDEPGIYIEDGYGIRIESIMLTADDFVNEYGRFMKMEPLTFAPLDLDAIDVELLSPKDKKRLNDYHRQVREKISPFLTGDELSWLIESTREI